MIRWFKNFRAPPPPWLEPRHVSQVENAPDYLALKSRLDTAWRDGRESVYRDRETGLYWQGVAMDHGPIGAADEQLEPIGLTPPDDIAVREEIDAAYIEHYIARMGVWAFDRVHFKLYSIVPGGQGVSEDNYFHAARQCVANLLPEMHRTPHFGDGFAIVQHESDAVWLRVHWWLPGAAYASRLFRTTLAADPCFEPADNALVGNVWEILVRDFERSSWVDVILRRTGSLSVYRQRFLPPGYY